MDYRGFIRLEVEGFMRRGRGTVTDIDDILIDEERRRQGERRRKCDEADGYFEVEVDDETRQR